MKWNAIPITVAKLTTVSADKRARLWSLLPVLHEHCTEDTCALDLYGYLKKTLNRYFRRRSCVLNERFIQYVEERELTYRKATNFRGFLLDIVFDNRENVSNTTH
ncbi:uncharacterized protein [Ptychodera flava]|uniref:uncharacterized protein n=1 Tax=Ptychodera flava TaxID=63121 RepID=UPI003969FDE0